MFIPKEVSYYIDQIEDKIHDITDDTTSKEMWAEYNLAFTISNDAIFARRLRVINEKINKIIDSQNMDGV